MGRGSSKAGESRMAKIKQVQSDLTKVEVNQTINRIALDSLNKKKYTYRQSERDGKAIDKNTDIGDVITRGGKSKFDSFTKKGNNNWVDAEGESHETDGMARVISGLTTKGNSNWTLKSGHNITKKRWIK